MSLILYVGYKDNSINIARQSAELHENTIGGHNYENATQLHVQHTKLVADDIPKQTSV